MAQTSVLDRLAAALSEAGRYNKSVQAAPSAVLWPDAESQWVSVIPLLQAAGLQVLTYGAYDPDRLQGPAIWLKTAIAGALDGVKVSDLPLIYLPGVSRSDLRAVEHCPRELQPLAELQYRGVFWTQANGKDWTVNAFLSSKNSLGFNVSADQETQKALLRAVSSGVLLSVPVADLDGRLIDAAYLNNLLAPNSTRDILAWLNAPSAIQAEWQGEHWSIFTDRCRADYGFDPVADGELVAAEKLAARAGAWAGVWELYEDSWGSFPRVVDLLSKVTKPHPTGLFDDFSTYPAANQEGESALRSGLVAAGTRSPEQARKELIDLEGQHAERRGWIWARMKLAPLAAAIENLAALAELTKQLPVGDTPDALATSYTKTYWRADALAWQALACVHAPADVDAVVNALAATYTPWLDATAHRFQDAVKAQGHLVKLDPAPIEPGTCVIFVDGLRYDVAVSLKTLLSNHGKTKLDHGWSPIPSVTASGKAWCSPVAGKISGTAEDVEFEPRVAESLKPLNSHNFVGLLKAEEFQVLASTETGDPTGKAWTAAGDLDHYGHAHELRLAWDLGHQLQQIVDRIEALTAAGWKRFRIVTDHGWLLVPGKLPKTELSKKEAETRWGRCAVLKETATASVLAFGWDWCKDVQIAFAPGISNFVAGATYAHGGLSLQESLVPVLTLELAGAGAQPVNVKISKLAWRGLRCQIEISPALAGFRADVRTKAAAADTSVLAAPKVIDNGRASVAIEDDSLEGSAVVVVIIDQAGTVVQKANTTVGE